MSIALGIAAFLFGIGAGSLLMKIVIHWVALVLAALGRDIGNSTPQKTPAPKWHLIFAMVHPVPWALLFGVPYGTYHLIQDPPATGWISFLGGVGFALLAIPVATFITLRKIRAKAATASAEATGDDNAA